MNLRDNLGNDSSPSYDSPLSQSVGFESTHHFLESLVSSLKEDPRLIDLTVQKQTFELKKAKEEHDRSHDIAIKRLEMEERIALAKIKADSEIAVAQAHAQTKTAENQTIQAQLTLQMMEFLKNK